MTLNWPPSSMFPANPREEDLMASIHLCGEEKAAEGLAKLRRVNWGVQDFSDLDRDTVERSGGSCESIPSDVLDVLPSDPFGMDLGATFTAIAGWIGDLQMDSQLDSHTGEYEVSLEDDYNLVAEFEVLMFGSERSEKFDAKEDKESGDRHFDGGFVSFWGIEEILNVADENDWAARSHKEALTEEHLESCSGWEGEAPHDALEYVVKYLDVLDLISMESVCRTTRYWIRRDPSLWRSFHIDHPLSDRITDDALIRLTERAEGKLQCLSLVQCHRITDDGVKHVMQSNPTLIKLSVPGCIRLSMEGILNNLKAFSSRASSKLKCLRIGEFYGVTPQHFEELKHLLGADQDKHHSKAHKLRLYPFRRSHLCVDDGWGAIDIELCSKCQNPRILYDCPVEGCQGKPPTSQGCRACSLCIRRCSWCGICINSDTEYEETFFLEWICAGCWKEKAVSAGTRHAILHHETKYSFRLYC